MHWREQILNALQSSRPIILLATAEEERAEKSLNQIAGQYLAARPHCVVAWDILSGLTAAEGLASNGDSKNPKAVLDIIRRRPEPGFYILRDFKRYLSDPAIMRQLQLLYLSSVGQDKYIFLIAPDDHDDPAAPEIARLVTIIDFPPPDQQEIFELVTARMPNMSEILRLKLAVLLKGLTENDIRHFLWRIKEQSLTEHRVLEESYAEKQQLSRKTGLIEYIPVRYTASDIGGMDNLKDWLEARKDLFLHQEDVPPEEIPRGLMLMGIPGCGKSLAIKTIPAIWNVPLFRLDFSVVFSGRFGPPAGAFNRCLRAAEQMAPCILWIDELENSLGLDEATGGGGSDNQVFAKFLNWMQEKPPGVFVAATANRVKALPGEVIRRGRFDEIFYCPAPPDAERRDIFAIHLRKAGYSPEEFDLAALVRASKQWTGSEIEQAVLDAKWTARQKNTELTNAILLSVARRCVPLAKAAEAQMREIHAWASMRARSVSRHYSLRDNE